MSSQTRSAVHECRGRSRRLAGFTLLEILISLAVLSVVMGATLFTLTRMDALSHQQLTITEVQQSARAAHDEIVRMTRMAGRGGLQQDQGPLGRAIVVRNNAGLDGVPTEVASAAGDPPEAMVGTDILIVRGVMTSDLLTVNYQDITTSSYDPSTGTGSVTISAVTRTGVAQDLTPLTSAITGDVEEAIVIIDALDTATYGVARLVPSGSSIDATSVTVEFDTQDGYGPDYAQLSRDFDGDAEFPDLNNVAFVGVLEEYRYYVRDDEDLGPVMSRARVFPNTETAWRNDDSQLQVDYALGVVDLQVALAFDSSIDGSFDDDDNGVGLDDEVVEQDRSSSTPDDWLYNQPNDDPSEELWAGPWVPEVGALAVKPNLFAIRVSTLAMAHQIERGHPSELLQGLEDRDYTTDADDPINGEIPRLKRKRLLQTVIKPRNL